MIEYVCYKCNGVGILKMQKYETKEIIVHIPIQHLPIQCPLCKGTGKLTWVENVLGKDDSILEIWCF